MKFTVDSSRRQDKQDERVNALGQVGGAKHPHGGQGVLGAEDLQLWPLPAQHPTPFLEKEDIKK